MLRLRLPPSVGATRARARAALCSALEALGSARATAAAHEPRRRRNGGAA